MLQKIKIILPWVLVVILTGMLLYQRRNPLNEIESTIETKTQVEESLIDSFYVERQHVQILRDSSFQVIDTLGIFGLRDKLRENILWYETDSTLYYHPSMFSDREITGSSRK